MSGLNAQLAEAELARRKDFGVILRGKTYLRIRDLEQLYPKHPLLTKLVRFKNTYQVARDHPDMLVAVA